MKSKILITGPPRCGKSTLISKLIDYYFKKNYVIYGFLTPEVRKNGKRIGFDIEDINSRAKARLARIGNFETRFKLGKYCIFIKEFEEFLSRLELIENKKVNLLIIDEIGKMELCSERFQKFIKKIYYSNITIIATIGQKMRHPIKDYIFNIPNVILFNLTRQNQEDTFKKIISIFP